MRRPRPPPARPRPRLAAVLAHVFLWLLFQLQPHAVSGFVSPPLLQSCCPPPHAAAAASGSGAAGSTDPPSPFLVLFKGGAAGSGDEGTSLACLRECEFRGLAYDVLGDRAAVASIHFTDALTTDLSLSGGRRPNAQEPSEEEEEEEDEEDRPSSSLMYVHGMPTAEALWQIVSRAVLIHAAYEILASGPSYEACAAQTTLITNEDPRLQPLQDDKMSWAAIAWVFGATCGRKKALAGLPQKLAVFKQLLRRLPGPVQLKDPDVQFALLEDGDLEEGEPRHKVFFTRQVAKGSRGLTERLSLRRRSYVTTTSMEPKASLVMCHAASLRPGDSVLDPMAGGGGLLLAAAQLGAGRTVGVDVNVTIAVDRIEANFHELGLPPPAAFVFGDVGEAAVQERVAAFGPFDILLCDPPYGKRERGALRAEGAVQEAVYTLFKLAANNHLLRAGGRLTFFLPMDPVWAAQDILPLLPSHPCLQLVDISRQPLNTRLDRYLVTLHKTALAKVGEVVKEGSGGTKKGMEGRERRRDWHYR